MKYFVPLIYLLALFTITWSHRAGHCSATSRMTMARCYQDYLKSYGIQTSDISVDLFQKKLTARVSTWQGVENICHDFEVLKRCLNSAIINDCMNVEEFKKLTMALEERAAEIYVAHFYTTDYSCNEGYEDFKTSYNCLLKANISCDVSTPMECQAQEDNIDKFSKKVGKVCGQSALKFTRNYKITELCHILPKCDICKNHRK